MRFRRSLGLAALFALSFSVGCSMTNPTVRGQTPDNTGPIVGSAPGYGEFKRAPYLGNRGQHDFKPYSQFRNNNFGYEGGYYAPQDPNIGPHNQPYTVNAAVGGPPGPPGAVAAGATGVCPDCNSGQSCPQNGCQRCGRGCGYRNGMPQHYQTYQYDWPKNMVYPQQGTPSGIVQYPYYTLRGPTDFFMN